MKTIDAANARRLAVQASVDPRTIIKVLKGVRVRGDAKNRAQAALSEFLRQRAVA